MCFFVVAPKKEFHFNCRKQCIYKFAVQYEKLLPAGYYFFNTETEHQRMSNIKRCLFEMRKKKTKKSQKCKNNHAPLPILDFLMTKREGETRLAQC